MNQTRLSPFVFARFPDSFIVHCHLRKLRTPFTLHARRFYLAIVAIVEELRQLSSLALQCRFFPRVIPTACQPLSLRCSWVSISHSLPLSLHNSLPLAVQHLYIVFHWYTVPRTVFPYHSLGGLFYFEEKQCYYVKLQRIPQRTITPDLLTLFFW